ncbi:MAG: 50S ribosomal protein L18 [Gammaproteobacteria bacterium]|jgi:large subunit ribosomal protein L18|uniref:50S ribosomal protein L18 n=1 Tax=marine metagenome TaxID=408172 RepID=A0A381MZ08_9ZZZZ|nr:50S ribosomal protein L18 [Gammaproteobacteria bacterium]MEE3172142.1 50S ribosomal protein L18 [Pseudomonadota bacterium]|tara:strand:- start:539 stop:889 length:351 start_codon:yes stop_codon:yes gene_type:complete
MSAKKTARLRRAKRGRAKINELRMNRLCVFRSPKHIYAQIISATGNEILVSASTLEKSNKSGATGNIDAAGKIGKLIAERAKKAGIEKVAFDRSGYAYHGRVKALAEAARESGLEF